MPDGSLTGDGVKQRIRKKLLEDCNLHTIVRLHNSVFQPYAWVATNLLFFSKGEQTKTIWYYQHKLPEGYKAYSKTKPIQGSEFDKLKHWWVNREESEVAWQIDFETIKASGYNLDMKNPNQLEEEQQHSSAELLDMLHQSSLKGDDLLVQLRKGVVDSEGVGLMSNMMLPIGSLFDLEKGVLQSSKCSAGEFDFITAAEEWKTHNQYSHECEALIFAAAASGSLGRTHYVNGKFTSSDLCFILTPKDDNKYPLNLSFYHFVFNSLRSVLVSATKSGTSKESINQKNFKKYKIPYFDIDQQEFWIRKLKSTLGIKDLLDCELAHQRRLLKKLHQQILQDCKMPSKERV